ncbi:MAG: 1-(5-phosphoribosyl)-5-[(5-phosphoribosylamino)methylideneamino]imidazole-4-carboxamide isomerase [Candidatus Omnitrophica bacterium]|nr:1-(5-phosphoribosyl)-5-[(5-phosphoribosylamino)methylideneamino]imidazole-4-carboxamide isomerase [Candidatus Omnitrophota bacterium]
MLIIPAIDLYKGKVVRFVKGDPVHSTVYSDDPLLAACNWVKEGAEVLHIVDLSAALGEADNADIIEQIIKEINVDIEVGGGIRDVKKALRFKKAGAKRIIVGTKSLEDKFLKELLSALGRDSLAVSVDTKEGFVATHGWQDKSKLKPIEFIEHLSLSGIKWVIYTDISRDGTLEGLNFKALKELAVFKDINFIASGGVSSLNDIKEVKDKLPFIWGIISGKALYDKKIDLKAAISILG